MQARSIARRLAQGFLALLAAAGVAAAAASPSKDWAMTSLGTLPSQHPFSIAEAVNNAGDIVGWSTVYDPAINSNRTYAVLWSNGTLMNLGEGSALSVNDRGTIAGSVVGGLSIWKDGQWTHLGMSGAPNGINKFDAIAGWFMGGQNHAYLYQDGVLHDLGTLGGSTSSAEAINDHGQVVGTAQTSENYDHAFLFDGASMMDLGTLEGGHVSRAHDINNHGVVVGEAWQANGNAIPFIYDGGAMRRLFPSSDCCIVPRAINDHGDVVGTIAGNASFLYADGVLTRLESLPAVQAGGWTQLIPTDINDRGWIVGMARKGALQPASVQEWYAFVLRPPHS